jgi:hypothetical protein
MVSRYRYTKEADFKMAMANLPPEKVIGTVLNALDELPAQKYKYNKYGYGSITTSKSWHQATGFRQQASGPRQRRGERFFSATFSESVTYVLNLLRYLCPEPVPFTTVVHQGPEA